MSAWASGPKELYCVRSCPLGKKREDRGKEGGRGSQAIVPEKTVTRSLSHTLGITHGRRINGGKVDRRLYSSMSVLPLLKSPLISVSLGARAAVFVHFTAEQKPRHVEHSLSRKVGMSGLRWKKRQSYAML